jgi:transcription antitermination factor NusG
MTREATPDGTWVAVQVKSGVERAISAQLTVRGYEHYLPMFASKARSGGGLQWRPLFQGYVFCCYDAHNPYRIVQIPGVIRLVGTRTGPIAINVDELDAVRRLLVFAIQPERWTSYQVGQRVRVVSGPVAGLEGMLVRVRNKCRLVLAITVVQRAFAIEVDARDVRPVGPLVSSDQTLTVLQPS